MLPLNCIVSFTLCVIFSFPQWTNSKRRMKKLHKCPFSHRRKLSRRRPIQKIAHKIEMLHKSNHYKLDFWSSSLICKTVLLWFGLMNIYFAFSTRFITIAMSRAMHSYFRKKNANTNSNFFLCAEQRRRMRRVCHSNIYSNILYERICSHRRKTLTVKFKLFTLESIMFNMNIVHEQNEQRAEFYILYGSTFWISLLCMAHLCVCHFVHKFGLAKDNIRFRPFSSTTWTLNKTVRCVISAKHIIHCFGLVWFWIWSNKNARATLYEIFICIFFFFSSFC